jgi:hypothetical protein
VMSFSESGGAVYVGQQNWTLQWSDTIVM